MHSLLRATSVILSRAVSGKSMPFTLVPVMDLFNHSKTHNCNHRYDNSSDSFVVETTRDVRAGEELVINYGELRDNVSMFCVYGFVEHDNPNDRLRISMAPSGDGQSQRVESVLERFHLGSSQHSHVCEVQPQRPGAALHELVSINTLPFLRVYSLSEEQLQRPDIDPWRRISADNERAAVQRLLMITSAAIADRQVPAAQAEEHVARDPNWAETCQAIRDFELMLLRQLVQECERTLKSL